MIVIASGIWEWSWCERQMTNRRPSSHSKVLIPWIASPGSIGWAPSVSQLPMKRRHPWSSDSLLTGPPHVLAEPPPEAIARREQPTASPLVVLEHGLTMLCFREREP